MFSSLLAKLFPSFTKQKHTPNYEVFANSTADSEKITNDLVKAIANNYAPMESSVLDENVAVQRFQEYLFGRYERSVQNEELNKFVIAGIERALNNPKYLIENLPILPLSLSTLLKELNREEFSTDLVIEVIESEPSIAAKVIELANSTFYHRGNKAITDLKSAFMCLGVSGLTEGVINGFVSQLTPQPSVYYKQFGDKIWQHSLATGQLTKLLLEKEGLAEESGTGYFLGLVINLGNMIIFQLMTEAFAYVNPEARPDHLFFQKVIDKYSLSLTYKLAHFWHLPESICKGLAVQKKITSLQVLSKAQEQFPVAVAVYESHRINMLMTLVEHDRLLPENIKVLIPLMFTTDEAKHYLLEQTSLKANNCQ